MQDYYRAPRGLSATNRLLLSALSRCRKSPVSASDASEVWGISVADARRKLGRLARSGWLSRVAQGLYVLVPIEAEFPATWNSDPWIVAAKMLSPCYIGGWTACEHWELTDQIFRDIVVFTTRNLRTREISLNGASIRVVVAHETRFFGTVPRWRDAARITISDPSRTLVDILSRPELGAGIRHVSDVLSTYFRSKHRNDSLLAEYGDRLGNRSMFKRLGYLIEALGIPASDLTSVCKSRMSTGISDLEPGAGKGGRIVTRWKLRLNVSVRAEP